MTTTKEQIEILEKALLACQNAGQKQIGWKLGFGSPAALKSLNTSKPLIGGLFDTGELKSGSTTDVSNMTKPCIEAEIAAYISSDIAENATENQIIESVASLVPAIELVDFHTAPSDPETILTDNIFQRGWVMLPSLENGWASGAKGLEIHISQGNETWDPATDIEAKIGSLTDNILNVTGLQISGKGHKKRRYYTSWFCYPPQPSNGKPFIVSIPGKGEVSLQFTH